MLGLATKHTMISLWNEEMEEKGSTKRTQMIAQHFSNCVKYKMFYRKMKIVREIESRIEQCKLRENKKYI